MFCPISPQHTTAMTLWSWFTYFFSVRQDLMASSCRFFKPWQRGLRKYCLGEDTTTRPSRTTSCSRDSPRGNLTMWWSAQIHPNPSKSQIHYLYRPIHYPCPGLVKQIWGMMFPTHASSGPRHNTAKPPSLWGRCSLKWPPLQKKSLLESCKIHWSICHVGRLHLGHWHCSGRTRSCSRHLWKASPHPGQRHGHPCGSPNGLHYWWNRTNSQFWCPKFKRIN